MFGLLLLLLENGKRGEIQVGSFELPITGSNDPESLTPLSYSLRLVAAAAVLAAAVLAAAVPALRAVESSSADLCTVFYHTVDDNAGQDFVAAVGHTAVADNSAVCYLVPNIL